MSGTRKRRLTQVSYSPEVWDLALAVNAAFKGLLGSHGQSGHICNRTESIQRVLRDLDKGWSYTIGKLARLSIDKLENGDVVVIPDKIVAIAQGRIGPRAVLHSPDPKTIHRKQLRRLAERWQLALGFKVLPIHLLLADEYRDDKATLGAEDHNFAAYELASEISSKYHKRVDVIISDTDTGLDIKAPLINTITIGATPLGATNGLNLYEAMRCAVAAEFVRGHTRGIPIVVCKPADRRRSRNNIGAQRSYAGTLDALKEKAISYV